MAGDVKQVPLLHVLAQPSPAHAAAIEVVGKEALDNLSTQLAGLAGSLGLETHAVVGDRAPRRPAPSPCQREKLFCLGSLIRVFQRLSSRTQSKTALE